MDLVSGDHYHNSRDKRRSRPFSSSPREKRSRGSRLDDSVTEEETKTYGREEKENVGTVASPSHFHETQYGIRKDGQQLMIGDSLLVIDSRDNITIKGTVFKGTEGLWELLTRKNVNMEVINKNNRKT